MADRAGEESIKRSVAFAMAEAVGEPLSDLRAGTQMGMDIKIYRMNRLCIPQERIAKRLGQAREVIRDHSADLSQGFTVAQVAEKHGNTPT